MGVENCLSSLNVIVLHWVDLLNLLLSEIRHSEDSGLGFHGKCIRKTAIKKPVSVSQR